MFLWLREETGNETELVGKLNSNKEMDNRMSSKSWEGLKGFLETNGGLVSDLKEAKRAPSRKLSTRLVDISRELEFSFKGSVYYDKEIGKNVFTGQIIIPVEHLGDFVFDISTPPFTYRDVKKAVGYDSDRKKLEVEILEAGTEPLDFYYLSITKGRV